MPRSCIAVLAIAILCGTVIGCRKTDNSNSARPAVATDDPINGLPKVGESVTKESKEHSAATAGDVPIDLSQYRIRGEMTLPKDPMATRTRTGGWSFRSGEHFAIVIHKSDRPLAAARAAEGMDVVRWLRDDPTVYIAEMADNRCRFEARVSLAGETYSIRTPAGETFPAESTHRMVQSALSLRQTDSIRESILREEKARSALKAAGCDIEDQSDGPTLAVVGDKIVDEDLEGIKDIAGLVGVTLGVAPRVTAKGTSFLATNPALERLVLTGPGITDSMVLPLQSAKSVRSIVIAHHRLTDSGLEFLSGLSRLESLTLDGESIPRTARRIKGEGLVHLAALRGLTRLKITSEFISDSGLQHLGKVHSLKQIHLDRLPMTDAGLRHFESLTGLERVAFTRLPIRGYGLSAIASAPRLSILDLTGSAVVDAGLERLRGSTVAELNLALTGISDAGLRVIPELPRLQTLNLRGTRIKDGGLVHLGRAPLLHTVVLDETDVTGSGFTHFKARTGLRSLSANHSLVNDAALAELPGCPNLETVSVVGTPVSDRGLDHLHPLKSLMNVSVFGTDITQGGVDRFKAAHPNVKLGWKPPIPVPDPAIVVPPIPLEKLPAADPAAVIKKHGGEWKTEDEDPKKPVVSIELDGSNTTDLDLANLRDLKSLQTLDLSGCRKVTDSGLPYLAGLRELRELRLGGTGIRGDGLSHLKDFTRLTVLELPSERFTLKQLAPLAAMKDLETLKMVPPVDKEGYLRFLSSFPRLKAVNLQGLAPTPRRLALIGKLTSLERLDLESGLVSDRGLASIKGLTHLKEFRLASELVTDAGLQQLSRLSEMKILEITGSRLTDAGFQFIRQMNELERLKISGTGLTDRGMVHFQSLEHLIELDLQRADISDAGIASLAELKDVEFIDLSETKLTDEGLKHFRGLEELRTLKVEGTRITGRGFAQLKNIPRLARLLLGGTDVDDEGAAAIGRIEAIEQLDLTGTAITDAGIARLKDLPNLRHLILDRTSKLTDKVVDVLKSFPSLQDISVRETNLSILAISDLKKKEGLTVHVE